VTAPKRKPARAAPARGHVPEKRAHLLDALDLLKPAGGPPREPEPMRFRVVNRAGAVIHEAPNVEDALEWSNEHRGARVERISDGAKMASLNRSDTVEPEEGETDG
jgi:hypothetical protein